MLIYWFTGNIPYIISDIIPLMLKSLEVEPIEKLREKLDNFWKLWKTDGTR